MLHRIALLLLLGFSLVGAQTYEYDDAGRLIEIRFPDGKGVAYTHDDAGNLTGVTPLTLPPAPTAFQINAGDSFIQALNWVDNADNESAYRVERRLAGRYSWETLAELPADSTAYSDPLRSYDRDFRYRISALAPGNLQSAFSDEAGMVRRSRTYFANAADLGEDWVNDPVLSLLYTARFPWVFSPDHGWWYLNGADRDSLFLYDLSLGWLWTTDDLYPYLYSFSLQSFLYFAQANDTSRYFYDFNLADYREVPKSLP